MEKRILVAVSLSFLVLVVYQSLFVKPPRQVDKPREVTAPQENIPRSAGSSEEPAAAAQLAAEVVPVSALVGDVEAREIIVEMDAVTAVFVNRGAVLKSWQLKHYLDGKGAPLDLVPSSLPAGHARPFALGFDEDDEVTRRLGEALFKTDQTALRVTDRATLTFEYRDEAGLAARKQYTFNVRTQPYVVSVEVSVEKAGRKLTPTIEWGPGLGDQDAGAGSSYYVQKPGGILLRDGRPVRVDAESAVEQPVHDGRFRFAGVDDTYFLAAALVAEQSGRVSYKPVAIPSAGDDPPRDLMAFSVRLPESQGPLGFFIGPKDFDVLKAIDAELVRAIDFGWFAWLVVPLLLALKTVNAHVGNYGWSIIILTVVINALMFPLRHKSVVSMRRMQEIQPEVKAIQDRYAKLKVTDPAKQKMNQELMALYRERGVNPASGCIPMVLTFPVLFAFYSLLSKAIEIRGAPFILWIKDLSLHDPLYVTPILMGVSMVWQQKITPATGDPMQRKLMMLMPIMFTFMFLWAPSGLVLYWLASNVWAIGQQEVTNRIIGPPAQRVVRPPAERRVRSAGSGKAGQIAGAGK